MFITLSAFLFVSCPSCPLITHALSIAFVGYVIRVNRYERRGNGDLLNRNYCSRMPTIPCIYTVVLRVWNSIWGSFHIFCGQKLTFLSYCNTLIHRLPSSLCMISYIYMRFVFGAFAWKSHNNAPLASSSLSVGPSFRMKQFGSHYTDFHEI
jgi:hypothetical protein